MKANIQLTVLIRTLATSVHALDPANMCLCFSTLWAKKEKCQMIMFLTAQWQT